MEASALQAPAGLVRNRIWSGQSLLRLRSDEQLVNQFRAGDEEAFRAIHDRYRQRLFAYARQMLPSRQDAEDVLQDVFVRAYGALRASNRELALRAWLYRIAHNRCIDELRRPGPPPAAVLELVAPPVQDPIAQAEQRESLRRLIADVRRLPEQQRSALLMRELTGMSYIELAGALSVSVPAVKSLLVRARVSLAQSAQARETACAEIREELILAHDCGRRPLATARRHLRDCPGCREFRREVRGVSRQMSVLVPGLGPAGILAKTLGFGGGGSAAAGGSGAAAGGGALSGLFAGTGVAHVMTLLAAAAVTAGGAVEIQHTLAGDSAHPHARRVVTIAAAISQPISQPALRVLVTPPTLVDQSAAAGGSATTFASTQSAAPVPASGAAPAVVRAPVASRTSTVDPGSTPLGTGLDPSFGPGPLSGPSSTTDDSGSGASSQTGSSGSGSPGSDGSAGAGAGGAGNTGTGTSTGLVAVAAGGTAGAGAGGGSGANAGGGTPSTDSTTSSGTPTS